MKMKDVLGFPSPAKVCCYYSRAYYLSALCAQPVCINWGYSSSERVNQCCAGNVNDCIYKWVLNSNETIPVFIGDPYWCNRWAHQLEGCSSDFSAPLWVRGQEGTSQPSQLTPSCLFLFIVSIKRCGKHCYRLLTRSLDSDDFFFCGL